MSLYSAFVVLTQHTQCLCSVDWYAMRAPVKNHSSLFSLWMELFRKRFCWLNSDCEFSIISLWDALKLIPLLAGITSYTHIKWLLWTFQIEFFPLLFGTENNFNPKNFDENDIISSILYDHHRHRWSHSKWLIFFLQARQIPFLVWFELDDAETPFAQVAWIETWAVAWDGTSEGELKRKSSNQRT